MNKTIKKLVSALAVTTMSIGLLPVNFNETKAAANIIYPLKKISKLECRFNEFDTLWDECIEDLPILKTSDYRRYSTENGWYNKYTRTYTVLWWASYKYWWDQGYGWHMWVDIATAKWTPVYAMSDWEVINARFSSAEWNFISIKHNFNWEIVVSNYMHLSKILVSKWDIVRAWDEIWKVWSTWNSTGNHLHFQIDTSTKFSPVYYDRKTCPYSYYEIVEKGVCFDELEKITMDPLLFLETNGAVLNSGNHTNKISMWNKNTTTTKKSTTNINKNTTTKTVNVNNSIFDKQVFIDSPYGDVREVQWIYKALWYYKWELTWDYHDLIESVVKYQLDKWIISARWDAWTGNFWPKTRAQTKLDYNKYLANGGKPAKTYIAVNTPEENISTKTEETQNEITIADDNRVTIWGNKRTEKISRENLITREELEAKEVNDFLNWYNIDLKFNSGTNVSIWWTETLNLSITDRKGKYFKWNMPGAMTFELNNKSISVFPERLFFFTDWKREIKISWLKEWATTLTVKVWNVIIKTFTINVYNGNKTITPDSAQIIWQWTYLWATQTWIWLLKQKNTVLTNLEYSWTYKLKASEWNLVCIKNWNISDLKSIYKANCNDNDFKNEVTFTYKDTVWGLVVFNYKALNKNAKFEISRSWKTIWASKIVVFNDVKWLEKNYVYSKEVKNAVEKWIATTWFIRWHFMQDQNISKSEALTWIKNALKNISTTNNNIKLQIVRRIEEIEWTQANYSDSKNLTRAELLELANNFLVFDNNSAITINYKDLNENQNLFANSVFNKNETWKEATWENYFRPNSLVTRWETAYLLMKSIKNWNSNNLTLR